MLNRAALPPLLFLSAVLTLTTIAYWPGLHGGFLFDDFGNLPAIGAGGPIDSWPRFWRYLTSGIADPTGRPLTLLSFLLDARDWPADPYPFKRTSLILHLLNGTLLYILLNRLGALLGFELRRVRMAALAASAMWLLHPLLVSTTLYIVQREAMLPATCVLVGLLIWLHGRSRLVADKVMSGTAFTVLGLGGFTLLGVLAKANGALLPIYALLIEGIVLIRRHPLPIGRARRAYHVSLNLFATLPALTIATYLLWVGIRGIMLGGPALRPWTYAQRLLTEPRVLFDYLWQLWLPHPFSSGLFNDQYTASTSLMHPVSTLPAILAITIMIIGAWHLKRGHPALALTILFYFAGQLLESTSIPLELYFEHRNYVPAMLMFWPLGLWLGDIRTLSVLKHSLMLALLLGLALMTHVRADLWGNVKAQALMWARINPDSARAQVNAAQIELQMGDTRQAISRLQATLARQPDQAQIVFNLIGARCMSGGLHVGDLAAARTAMLGTANTGSLFSHWFDRMLPVVMSGSCPGLGPADLLGLIDAALRNPRLYEPGPQQDLIYLRGRIKLAQHRPDDALADFEQALDQQVRPGMALEAAATLGSAGYPRQGLSLLNQYEEMKKNSMPPTIGMPMLHEWVLARENYWPHELARLRRQLSLDANASEPNTAQSNLDQSTNR